MDVLLLFFDLNVRRCALYQLFTYPETHPILNWSFLRLSIKNEGVTSVSFLKAITKTCEDV
jgi:hypothetical protein